MAFRLIQAGPIELCDRGYEIDIESVIARIFNHNGYKTRDEMNNHIRAWATTAKAGDVLTTYSSVIVAGPGHKPAKPASKPRTRAKTVAATA